MFERPLGFETRVISHVQGGGVKRDFRKVEDLNAICEAVQSASGSAERHDPRIFDVAAYNVSCAFHVRDYYFKSYYRKSAACKQERHFFGKTGMLILTV